MYILKMKNKNVTLVLISTSGLFLMALLRHDKIRLYKSSASPSEISSKLIKVNAIACAARQASFVLLFLATDFFNNPKISSNRFSI